MDTAGLKALQTLGDAGHFFIFHPLRKEIPQRMKYTARSADEIYGEVSRCLVRERFVPVCRCQAICMGIGGVFGAIFLYI